MINISPGKKDNSCYGKLLLILKNCEKYWKWVLGPKNKQSNWSDEGDVLSECLIIILMKIITI